MLECLWRPTSLWKVSNGYYTGDWMNPWLRLKPFPLLAQWKCGFLGRACRVTSKRLGRTVSCPGEILDVDGEEGTSTVGCLVKVSEDVCWVAGEWDAKAWMDSGTLSEWPAYMRTFESCPGFWLPSELVETYTKPKLSQEIDRAFTTHAVSSGKGDTKDGNHFVGCCGKHVYQRVFQDTK